MDFEAFGRRMNRARKDRGITAEALGEMINVNPVHVRQMASGKKHPSVESLVNICNALEVSPDTLLVDSLGDYVNEGYHALSKKLMELTPSQLDVIAATLDAMISINKK